MRKIPFSCIIALLFTLQSVAADATSNQTTKQIMLNPKHKAVLSSRIAGTIQQLPVSEGNHFKAGQPLVEFDCTVHKAQLAQALAQLDSREATYHSNLRLSKDKAIGKTELIQSKADLIEMQAEVSIKQHTVGHCSVLAPFDGIMVKQHVNAHESVRENDELVEIIDNGQLTIELIVPSNWLAWIRVNTTFSLHIEETQQHYAAHITHILPQVDSVSQTVRVLGQLDSKSGDLVAGMSGQANFEPPTTSAANE